jgi:DNA-binding transcriptional MerR regulator
LVKHSEWIAAIMYIGEISKKTGASVKAIRFYEELGLLTDVERLGSYRIYTADHLLFIQLIVKAKTLGFKLAELKQFILQGNVQQPWSQILAMIDQKQQALAEEIKIQQARQETLSDYRAQIQHCLKGNPDCQLEEGV